MVFQWASPDLQNLVELFFKQPDHLGQFQQVEGSAMPESYQGLLDHNNHMTVTVQDYHGCLVDVEVMEVHHTENHYSRKILLRRQADRKVVQFGIVRIAKNQVPADVMGQIEKQETPLGRILIENNILRTVKLLGLWKVQAGDQLRIAFEDSSLTECFGRTAFLYLDGAPVVELLEVVVS